LEFRSGESFLTNKNSLMRSSLSLLPLSRYSTVSREASCPFHIRCSVIAVGFLAYIYGALLESCFHVSFRLTNIICIAIFIVYSVHYIRFKPFRYLIFNIKQITNAKGRTKKITFNSIFSFLFIILFH